MNDDNNSSATNSRNDGHHHHGHYHNSNYDFSFSSSSIVVVTAIHPFYGDPNQRQLSFNIGDQFLINKKESTSTARRSSSYNGWLWGEPVQKSSIVASCNQHQHHHKTSGWIPLSYVQPIPSHSATSMKTFPQQQQNHHQHHFHLAKDSMKSNYEQNVDIKGDDCSGNDMNDSSGMMIMGGHATSSRSGYNNEIEVAIQTTTSSDKVNSNKDKKQEQEATNQVQRLHTTTTTTTVPVVAKSMKRFFTQSKKKIASTTLPSPWKKKSVPSFSSSSSAAVTTTTTTVTNGTPTNTATTTTSSNSSGDVVDGDDGNKLIPAWTKTATTKKKEQYSHSNISNNVINFITKKSWKPKNPNDIHIETKNDGNYEINVNYYN